MLPRLACESIISALDNQAAVALLGPRQSGKTTLALDIAQGRDSLYLDLEDSIDRVRLSEPRAFLEGNADRLVILDEVHRAPGLFPELRGIIDRGRREGKGIGRFLILGSASFELLQQSGESLAGRISYIELAPFSALEIDDDRAAREKLWLRGGFPGSYLAEQDQHSMLWRRNFIRTYLERDIASFGGRAPAAMLERLWTMIAHRQGSLVNASDLARALEINTPSVTRYIDLLCDLFLLRRLQPFHANLGKRLVKSPKLYVRDSGLVHALLGIEGLNELAGHPVIGMSWEGFVIETLIGVLPWGVRPYFYRTSAGAEIDLVLEFSDFSTWAIEIKRSASAHLARGFTQACEDLQPKRRFMVHAGDERFPVRGGVEAIGLRELAGEIAGKGAQAVNAAQ
jgi:uncharacterized protein